jgi:hypothetical protein
MPRITICVDANTPQQAAVDAWLARWRDRLDFCSDNEGCGCCVDIYRVECGSEALADLPPDVTCASEWSGYSRS